MKTKPLMILLVLAAVMVALAVKTSRVDRAAGPSAVVGKLLLPDLNVNDVARVRVVNQGTTVTVTRADGSWVLAEKHRYPANFGRVRDILVKLSELKIADQRQVTSETLKNFGVLATDPSRPDATRVELADASGHNVATLLLGKNHLRKSAGGGGPYGGDYPDGRYVSADDGASVFLVKDPLTDISAMAMAWMEPELVNVDAAEITQVTLTTTNGETLELSVGDDNGGLDLAGLAENEEVDGSKLSSLRNALAYLNLQDVADPARSDADLGFNTPATLVAKTRDGRTITTLLGNKAENDGYYLRAHVAFEPPPPSAIDTNAPPSVVTATATQATVDALNRRLANWTFVIPAYKAEAILLTRAELVNAKPAAEPPAPAAETAEEAPAAPATAETAITVSPPEAATPAATPTPEETTP